MRRYSGIKGPNLRERITLQNKTETTGPVITFDAYSDYKTIWAEARFLKGRNYYADRAVNVKTEVEFIIRQTKDINKSMRIKYNNEYYNIEGIVPHDNTHMYLMVRAYSAEHDGM